MMEGKFSGEGLQSLDSDEDLMSAMARELVEKAGVGESADQVWRQLDRERAKHMASTGTVDEDDSNDPFGLILREALLIYREQQRSFITLHRAETSKHGPPVLGPAQPLTTAFVEDLV